MNLPAGHQRYSIHTQRSLSQKHNRSSIDLRQNSFSTNECDISARKSYRPSDNPQREGRKNSLKDIMQVGYARPPATIVKPFNLSKSNSKQRLSHVEKTNQSSMTQRSKSPIARKPFTVYKSDKPLTIPKEFNFCGRTQRELPPKNKKDENLEDILKRLRANSSQRIVNENYKPKEHSLLIEKFKEFSGKEINNLLEVRNKKIDQMQNQKLNKTKGWK